MESSEKKNKFSLVKFISISASLVVVVAVAFFFLLNGKESLSSNNNENTIEVSRMSLSVGNEVDVDLGELSELDIEEISYSSKDENVAKINEMGKVTAVNSGETDIVVVYKVDNVTYEKNVSVTVSSKSSDDFSMSDEISLKYSFSDGVKENVWTNKDVKINVSSNVNVKYAIDCSENCKYYDLTDDKSILVTSEGEHVVTIMAYDKYGDSSVKKVNVKIDKTKPTCNFVKGPTPNEIYVGETATYVVECVDEHSRLKVVNDIDFLDIKFPGKFKFTKDSIVSVVKDIYKKTKKTAIQVENIDDGYRYTITVNGIKAGKTKLELPKSVFVDYAGNVQEKITSKEIKVVDKKSDSQNKTYLNCKISYSNGVLTGSGSGSNTLVYYGFSNSYSGSNATTKRITKAGTYNYYVKDNAGNKKSCSVVVDKKDLVPTCNLSFDEKTNRLTGTYADNSGGGMSYYGFSSTYGGSKTTWQYIKKSGTYYFYVKDKNGNTGSCEITVEIKPGKPTCSLSYSNGMLIASSYDINNVGFSYRGFSSSYSGVSEYTKVIGKPGTYNYYVKDKDGNTGSCSIDVKEIIEIKDPVCSPGAFIENHTCKTCPIGYYCDGVKKEQCPVNHTSAAGAGKIESCYTNIKPGNYKQDPHMSYYPSVAECPAGKYSAGGKVYYGSTLSCTNCPVGTYSGKGASSCTKCPEGYTNASEGSSKCELRTTCPAGQYVDGKNCRDCPSGSYCVDGVKSVCPSPYSKSDKKSDSINDCYIDVSAGNYIATVEAKTTTKCAKGTYKEKHRVYFGQNSSCTPCGSNTTTSGEGAKSKSECNVSTWCPAGQYLDNTTCKACPAGKYSAAGSTSCTTCAAGTYSKGGAASCTTCAAGTYQDKTGKSSCNNCPNGYTSSAGAKSQNQCYIKVSAGNYIAKAGKSNQTACPKGTYSKAHTVFYDAISKCDSCPDGYTTAQTGSTSKDACSVRSSCGAGSYISNNICVTCPIGYYCDGVNKNKCPVNHTSNQGAGKVESCYANIKAGYYKQDPHSTTYPSVAECPAGKYSAGGNVYYGSTSSCKNCPVGTYSLKGASSCTKCPANSTNNKEGSSECNIKTSCVAGQYLDKGVCKACPAGKYSAAGSTSCEICAAGTYSKGGVASCTTCAAGTYQDNKGQSSCKNCPSGYTSDKGAKAENKCYINLTAGYYVADGKANKCPAGQYSTKTGKVYYGDSTSCQKCSIGTYSSAGSAKCEMCPSGYTTSKEGSSSCDKRTTCSQGQYLENGICTKCPTGYTSAGGAIPKSKCYIKVAAGQYLKTANSTETKPCPQASYKSAHNVYYGSTSTCDSCKGKYTTASSGAKTESECYLFVSAGSYLASANSSTPVQCKAGTYSEGHKVYYGKTSQCNSCGAPYTSDAGATSKKECYINVSAGKYLATANSSTMASCPAGTYSSNHKVKYGSTSKCSDCGDGTYSGAGASSCTKCPEGYRDYSAVGSKSECKMYVNPHKYVKTAYSTTPETCPSGTTSNNHYVDYGKTSQCRACADGTYGVNGVCHTCPKNSYCANGIRNDCPSNYPYTMKEGASKNSDCYARVEPGKYIATSGGSQIPCKSGSFSQTTQIIYYGSTNSCESCPAGYKNSVSGATSRLDCYTNVSAGKYLSTKETIQTESCAKGTYKEAHIVYFGKTSSCTKCDSGTTTSGVGSTSKSACSVSTCVRDESCGCETYQKTWVYISTENKYQACNKNPSNGSSYRCTSYSTTSSSSGSSCRWECKKYEYKSTCTTYKCCEVNKGDDFEFNLIDFDFISDMVDQILSKLF